MAGEYLVKMCAFVFVLRCEVVREGVRPCYSFEAFNYTELPAVADHLEKLSLFSLISVFVS